MTSLVVGASLLAVATPAHAQPATATPVVPTAEVSEGVALGLALGGTAASWGALIAYGYSGNPGLLFVGSVGSFVGPSLGRWYARDGFTRGMGIRIVGLSVAFLGVLTALDSGLESGDDDGVDAILLISGGIFVAGTIDDIARAPIAARKFNARSNTMLVPTPNAHGGGVSLVGRF